MPVLASVNPFSRQQTSADVIKIITEKCPTAEPTMQHQSYTISFQYPTVFWKSSQSSSLLLVWILL